MTCSGQFEATLKTINVPVKVIWGEFAYITSDVAMDRVSHFRNGSLSLLPAGHGVQSDLPEQVAAIMLAEGTLTAPI